MSSTCTFNLLEQKLLQQKQIPTSHVCSQVLVDKKFSQICSTDEDESKGNIVNKCSTEEDESDFFHININKQKDAKNETKY